MRYTKKGRLSIMGRLIIDGNSVYEIDEECLRKKEQEDMEKKKDSNKAKRQGKAMERKE